MKLSPLTFLKSSAGVASAVLASGAIAAAATSMSMTGSATSSAEVGTSTPARPSLPQVTVPTPPKLGDAARLVAVPELGTVELIADAGALVVGDIHPVDGVAVSVVQQTAGAASVVFDGPSTTKVVEATLAEGDRIVATLADKAGAVVHEVDEAVDSVTVPPPPGSVSVGVDAHADASADAASGGSDSEVDLTSNLGVQVDLGA